VGKPTNINNVETFANVPNIIVDGATLRCGGNTKSKGTKVFALTGKINNTGLAEVPMEFQCARSSMKSAAHSGRQEIQGSPDRRSFRRCLPESMLDLQIDYES